MTKIILAILVVSILSSCDNPEKKKIDTNNRIELIPEHDKPSNKEISHAVCLFSKPDTSVNGIKIQDVESTLKVLGKHIKLQGDTTNYCYSQDKKQKLGLVVHAGSYNNEVSIFQILYSDDLKAKQKVLNIKEFETEKGIKLGINKRKVIEKLGTCYTIKDSTASSIEMYYNIESPNDSKTRLLKRTNMPFYYAMYKLKSDKLEYIEFGFEYP